MAKTVFIRTLGCQMNEYDSQVMAGMLTEDGYCLCRSMDDADIVLLNTCSVRQRAEEKVYGLLGMLKNFKEKKPDLIVGICGCMAQKEGGKLLERAGHLDIVCGTHRLHRIPSILDEVLTTRRKMVQIGEGESLPRKLPHRENGQVKAPVAVMRGCDSFCSFCVVPYLRGREKSRPPEDILGEVEHLARGGVKEITLLGQNVVRYGKDGVALANLLRKVSRVEGIERVRFETSHPRDVTDELLKAMADLPQVCEHLHLPVQSGSDKILKAMRRRYTADYYRKLVTKARMMIPGVAISTDIIVGFPGEDKEHFQATYDLMEEIGFNGAFIYKYSTRPGTKAAKMDDNISEGEKGERLEILGSLQEKVAGEKNKAFLNELVEVLVEGPSKKNTDNLVGRTRTNKVVIFKGGKDLTGRLVKVRIKETGAYRLLGQL